MFSLIAIAAAIAAFSVTLTRSSLFAPFRMRLFTPRLKWFAELAMCAYCVSHWVALAVVFLDDFRLGVSPRPLGDFFMTWFAVVGVSAVFIHLIGMGGGPPPPKRP